MKGLRLFFTACLAPLVFQAVAADNVAGVSRGAIRRATPTIATNPPRTKVTSPSRNITTNVTNSRIATPQTVRQRATNTNASNRALHTRTATTSTKNITARTSTPISARTIKTTSRTTTTRDATRTANRGRSSTEQTITRDEILSRDPKKCREVFYGCMDEFCANKDAQLKRCACSTRINEFRGNKENLALIEEKLLDFSQRLLTVSMDKEDAATLNQATEGELAFAQSDTSKSKQMLDEIAKKLNTSFNDSNFDQSLNAISLSLNTDAAFDSIDPTAGASTTTKSGTALYSAALPVCREMALEVCSPDELSIAEGGYQVLIEQDCNTVKKSYQAQSDAARAKVFESGALLDISRLDVHQQRNSDDILTCKTKMLNMLTDSTVCGTDMGKCLDTTGQYIDPTTGDAILSPKLSNLTNLIKRPESDNQTWATINTRYVSFLNSKKKFLEPAMENCQDIADYVWDLFIEDALSQIKIAQDAKLEQVRQSCTTLTAQCLDKTLDSITEFDARALSIFGISADKTANAMCADVKSACTALFQTTGSGDDSAINNWESGITEITTTKSYETILSTCREVGRNCIIQACTSITGNFGLCEDIDKSINRKAIINRRACWKEVYECVASAGADTIAQIMSQQNRPATNEKGHLYETLYANSTPAYIKDNDNIFDICSAPTDAGGTGLCGNTTTPDCQTCRIAEQIWGNCEHNPTTALGSNSTSKTNRIFVMDKNAENATLLSWFAYNTGTAGADDSCRDTTCPFGYETDTTSGQCFPESEKTTDGWRCPSRDNRFTTVEPGTNCCNHNGSSTQVPRASALLKFDLELEQQITTYSQCCINNAVEPRNSHEGGAFISSNTPESICSQSSTTSTTGTKILTISLDDQDFTLICVGTLTESGNPTPPDSFPNGDTLNCDGAYLLVSDTGIVLDPYTIFNNSANPSVISYYYPGNHDEGYCEYKCTTKEDTTTECEWTPSSTNVTCATTPIGWTVGPVPSPTTQQPTTQSE